MTDHTIQPIGTPLSDEAAKAEAERLIADAYRPTSYRDDTPLPAVGDAPPVAQPGRPPMSQGATDASVMMLAAGVASLPIGGMTALVLHVLGTVDPVQLAIGGAVPVALVLAVARLLGRARDVLPDEHHHHYTGPVYQDKRNVHTKNRGVWVKNSTSN